MADVFTVLGQDHQEVKRMLAELEKGPTAAAGASEDQLALRKKMTEELIIEESKHEALEEMYFWPAVRDHIQSGNTLADEATGQEQAAKQLLTDLDKLGSGDAEFERLLGKFIMDAREHIEFEETQVWPLLRTALPPRPRQRSGRRSPRARRPRPPGRIRTPRRRLVRSRPPGRWRRPRTRYVTS
jgi:hemerythrin-like domain-containing protein